MPRTDNHVCPECGCECSAAVSHIETLMTEARSVREYDRTEAVAAYAAQLRDAVEKRRAKHSQPDGMHVYGKGGIHADATRCGECGRLHEDAAVLRLIEESKP